MDRHANCQQYSLAKPAVVNGVGYWSGQPVTVEFRPAPPDSGIVFVRRDLPGQPRLGAVANHRVESPRRTTLAKGACHVEMVEHVLAALAGLMIDNCEVWVDQAEMPGCDGSSADYVEALLSAGIKPQAAAPNILWVTEVIRVGDDSSWVELLPNARGLRVSYELDYGAGSPIGKQKLQVDVSPDSFCRELAPARTFLLDSEARWLQEQGLGRHVSYQDLLVFGPDGPIDNQLRFEDECVRHKTLDLVGDFALAGCRIVGQVRAYRSGHRLNTELISRLLERGQAIQRFRNCA